MKSNEIIKKNTKTEWNKKEQMFHHKNETKRIKQSNENIPSVILGDGGKSYDIFPCYSCGEMGLSKEQRQILHCTTSFSVAHWGGPDGGGAPRAAQLWLGTV
jgi:hypothetical protein